MDSGVLRDIVIIILGVSSLVFYILAAILGLIIYFRIKKLTASVKSTISEAKNVGSEFKKGIISAKDLVSIIKGQRIRKETPPV